MERARLEGRETAGSSREWRMMEWVKREEEEDRFIGEYGKRKVKGRDAILVSVLCPQGEKKSSSIMFSLVICGFL